MCVLCVVCLCVLCVCLCVLCVVCCVSVWCVHVFRRLLELLIETADPQQLRVFLSRAQASSSDAKERRDRYQTLYRDALEAIFVCLEHRDQIRAQMSRKHWRNISLGCGVFHLVVQDWLSPYKLFSAAASARFPSLHNLRTLLLRSSGMTETSEKGPAVRWLSEQKLLHLTHLSTNLLNLSDCHVLVPLKSLRALHVGDGTHKLQRNCLDFLTSLTICRS